MASIWRAAEAGDVVEVERLVGQDPGLLDARDGLLGFTPLMLASMRGRVGVVRWLVDQGAAINERGYQGCTALWLACREGRAPAVRMLVEGGADVATAGKGGSTPLVTASGEGHLEVVRFLLGLSSAKFNINRRDDSGKTALWWACYWGRGGVARLLLDRGADPMIADDDDITPMAVAKGGRLLCATVKGRRECVEALEVRTFFPLPTAQYSLF
jgi:ankyrin repeat protein